MLRHSIMTRNRKIKHAASFHSWTILDTTSILIVSAVAPLEQIYQGTVIQIRI